MTLPAPIKILALPVVYIVGAGILTFLWDRWDLATKPMNEDGSAEPKISDSATLGLVLLSFFWMYSLCYLLGSIAMIICEHKH